MYWHGLNDPDASWELLVPATPPVALTAPRIAEVLHEIWDHALASPQPKYDALWKHPAQHITYGKVEKNVQYILTPILRAMLGSNFTVHPEDSQPSGRLDFSITPRSNVATGIGTIELKALCSRRESRRVAGYRTEGPAVHKAAIEKGLYQAMDAKGRANAEFAVLACYDFRMAPQRSTAFTRSVVNRAQTKDILLAHYPLYPSANERRLAEQAPARRVAESSPKGQRKS